MYEIIDSMWFSSLLNPQQVGLVAIRTKTEHGAPGWKAYLGNASGMNQAFDEQHVAEWGAKVPEAIAVAAFPKLASGEYGVFVP